MGLAAVRVLVQRDLVRFFRQRSRVVGALIQPLLFWLVIGSGMAGSFRMPGADSYGYLQYFFPGILVMVVLFTAIFTTMSVIEDRQHGFLQAVLVAPVGRLSLVLGKVLGGVAIALFQALLLVALAPLAGFPLLRINLPLLLGLLFGIGVSLSAVGFAIAWWINSTQGYHVIMNLLLLPLWILSGAMFPSQGAHGGLALVMRLNPLAYGLSGIRRALHGAAFQSGYGLAHSSATLEVGITIAFAGLALALAVRACARRA